MRLEPQSLDSLGGDVDFLDAVPGLIDEREVEVFVIGVRRDGQGEGNDEEGEEAGG